MAAYAQTPIDPSSVIGDPRIILHTPDPACNPPSCVSLEYTGPSSTLGTFFFPVSSWPTGAPIPPEYSCEVIDTQVPPPSSPPSCVVDDLPGYPLTPTEFFGVTLSVPDITNGQTFSISVTGGSVGLLLPSGPNASGPLECTPGCTPTGRIFLESTPEPGAALLYVTGLVLLVGFARKCFGATFLT